MADNDINSVGVLPGAEPPKKSSGQSKEVPWKVRKRVVIATLIFCAWVVGHLVLYGTDTRLNETIAMCAFALAGSTIGAFLFGQSWSDINMEKISSWNKSKGLEDEK